MESLPKPLVDCNWLSEHLQDEQLVILDASVPPVVPGFESVNTGDEPRVIPGARRFDYDREICDPHSSLPHMMPAPARFERQVSELGIGNASRIVVYDDVGIYASPRAWWMFKAMGHNEVSVLDGGLPAWLAAGHKTVSRYDEAPAAAGFRTRPVEHGFCDFNAVLAAIEDSHCSIVDARSAGRFYGREPEPRPNARSGHMPTAKNLPCRQVLDGHYMKPAPELQTLLRDYLDPQQTLLTSCGSGITACILTLAAYRAGHRKLQVYDGSWAEWGQPSKLPVVRD